MKKGIWGPGAGGVAAAVRASREGKLLLAIEVEPWLVRVDRRTGKIAGCLESQGHHSVEVNAQGEPLTGARPDKVLWFRSR